MKSYRNELVRRYRHFSYRHKYLFNGLPGIVALIAASYFGSKILHIRYKMKRRKENPETPSKEEILEYGVDIDTDLQHEELQKELDEFERKRIKK